MCLVYINTSTRLYKLDLISMAGVSRLVLALTLILSCLCVYIVPLTRAQPPWGPPGGINCGGSSVCYQGCASALARQYAVFGPLYLDVPAHIALIMR